MFGEHPLHIGSAASATETGGGRRLRGDRRDRSRAVANGAFDRSMFDVVAAADRLQTADGRMQLHRFVEVIHRSGG